MEALDFEQLNRLDRRVVQQNSQLNIVRCNVTFQLLAGLADPAKEGYGHTTMDFYVADFRKVHLRTFFTKIL